MAKKKTNDGPDEQTAESGGVTTSPPAEPLPGFITAGLQTSTIDVRIKRVGLNRLHNLFETCSLPEDSKKWIDALDAEKMQRPPYKELLDAIASEQQDMPNQAIEYGNVVTRLRVEKRLKLERTDVVDLCKALSIMAPGYIFARGATVELTQRPDKVLEAIRTAIREYPEDEQKRISSPQ